MSDTDNTGGTTPPEATQESLWQRLRSRFGRNRDVGLRESLEGAIVAPCGVRSKRELKGDLAQQETLVGGVMLEFES